MSLSMSLVPKAHLGTKSSCTNTSGKGIQSLEKICPIPPRIFFLGGIGQIFSRDWIPFPLVQDDLFTGAFQPLVDKEVVGVYTAI